MEPQLGSWLNQELYDIMLKRQAAGYEKTSFRSILPFPDSRIYSTMYINQLGSDRDWYGNSLPLMRRILKHLKIRHQYQHRAKAALRRGSGVAGKGPGLPKQLLRKARGERLAPTRQEIQREQCLKQVIDKISTELSLPSRWTTRRARGAPR